MSRNVTSQIVSVDVTTGERVEHTSGPGLKVYHQFLGPSEIGYLRKGGAEEGIFYTSDRPGFKRGRARAVPGRRTARR